jgi:hypothetical protein
MNRNTATGNGPSATRRYNGRKAWLRRREYRLSIEELEPRVVPAPVSATPWIDLGPQPQTDMLMTNQVDRTTTSQPEPVSGRVTSLALSSDIGGGRGSAMFVGAAGGGVWRSTFGQG